MKEDHPRIIPVKFPQIWPSNVGKENNVKLCHVRCGDFLIQEYKFEKTLLEGLQMTILIKNENIRPCGFRLEMCP